MSWSSGVHTVSKDGIGGVEAPVSYDEPSEAEQADQWQATLAAAKELAKAVGREGDEVTISASGHANPGHGPREGWADECITISITARPAQPPTAE